MLKITKRKDSPIYWITGTAPDGQRIRRSSKTKDKKHADELRVQIENDLYRVARLGEKPKTTWKAAAVRWIKEKNRDGRLIRNDLSTLKWLDQHLGHKTLCEIDTRCICALREAKAEEGASNATINRMLALVRGLLRKAEREWDLLDRAPSIKALSEDNQRIRWLTTDEARRLLKELPSHLADMAEFTLATGLRASNVKELEWSQIDLARRVAWIHPEQAKAGKAIPVPLNEMALEVLRRRQGEHSTWVFTFHGSPIGQHNTKAWKKALERAQIQDFRWHDLRHTWASWHVQNGTTLEKLQQLGGWGSYEMVLRYAHLAPEQLADAANNIGTILTQCTTKPMLKAA